LRTLVVGVLAAWLVLGGGGIALAGSPRESGTPSPVAGPTDPLEMEALLDSVLPAQMKSEGVAGAVVVVVKDGEVFFTKGYGYADAARSVPVDPQKTLFRIASVTKLFTWTAVMQLAEQGRLDLNADVNKYLDFQIPSTLWDEDGERAAPITLAHLMTHTAGFEDRAFETRAADEAALLSLGEWLATHIPARVRPPGELAAYSDYGAALAGYIVERVSGMPYEQYIEQNILSPLGMEHATARQPLPPELAADMSLGYYFDGAAFQPAAFELFQTAPAGGMSASAADMARFMLAHLQDGQAGGIRILEESSAQQMRAIQFRHHPSLNGMGYGFIEMDRACPNSEARGRPQVVGHGGDTLLFHSVMALLPEQNLGIFAAYNSENGDPSALLAAFLDHYYPLPAAETPPPTADFAGRAALFSGNYRPSRSSYTTVEKVLGLANTATISDGGDGSLLVVTPWGQSKFIKVEPLLFRQANGDELLAFRADDRGRITHAFFDSDPAVALEKLAWHETPALHVVVLAVGGVCLQSALVVGLVAWVRNRRRGGEGAMPLLRLLSGQAWPWPARAAAWLLGSMAVLSLMSVILLLVSAPSLVLSLMTGDVAGLKIALALNSVVNVLALGAVVMAVVVWKQRYWSLAGRVYYTLVALTALASLWSLHYWNLVGWSF